MGPKERVLHACKRLKPDRVPIDGLFCKQIIDQLVKEFGTNKTEIIYDELEIDFRRIKA